MRIRAISMCRGSGQTKIFESCCWDTCMRARAEISSWRRRRLRRNATSLSSSTSLAIWTALLFRLSSEHSSSMVLSRLETCLGGSAGSRRMLLGSRVRHRRLGATRSRTRCLHRCPSSRLLSAPSSNAAIVVTQHGSFHPVLVSRASSTSSSSFMHGNSMSRRFGRQSTICRRFSGFISMTIYDRPSPRMRNAENAKRSTRSNRSSRTSRKLSSQERYRE